MFAFGDAASRLHRQHTAQRAHRRDCRQPDRQRLTARRRRRWRIRRRGREVSGAPSNVPSRSPPWPPLLERRRLLDGPTRRGRIGLRRSPLPREHRGAQPAGSRYRPHPQGGGYWLGPRTAGPSPSATREFYGSTGNIRHLTQHLLREQLRLRAEWPTALRATKAEPDAKPAPSSPCGTRVAVLFCSSTSRLQTSPSCVRRLVFAACRLSLGRKCRGWRSLPAVQMCRRRAPHRPDGPKR